MKVVITAEEMQQIVADFMSRQTAFGEVSGVTFSANGATVFFNEEPVDEVEEDEYEEASVGTANTAPKKNRRRRRTKAEMKAAQETVDTEPEEPAPAVVEEDTTEPADIDALVEETVEDDLLGTTEEPEVTTPTEPDLFTEDDDDLFK